MYFRLVDRSCAALCDEVCATPAKKPGATTLADRAQAELDNLSAEGKAAIDAAMALAAAKDWAGARDGLKKVAAGYKGLPVEKEAAKALADVVKQRTRRERSNRAPGVVVFRPSAPGRLG